MTSAIEVVHLSFRYGERLALDDVSLSVPRGEIFAFLGPNGGGKTTLFRLLSTLIPMQAGEAHVLGHDVRRDLLAVREAIGVVFQAPSVDKKLTVGENLRHQGWLYGLRGRALATRQQELLGQLGLADRARDRVETLSGGLRRRVEIAKSLLHRPRILLMDEPSTGLDPAARLDLWHYLRRACDEHQMTVALTTHLLEEAEKADHLAILDRGRVAALDTPGNLRASLGGDIITIMAENPAQAASLLQQQFGLKPQVIGQEVRVQASRGHELLTPLTEALGDGMRSIALGKPTLEDVFVQRTGHRFWTENNAAGGDASSPDGPATAEQKRLSDRPKTAID